MADTQRVREIARLERSLRFHERCGNGIMYDIVLSQLLDLGAECPGCSETFEPGDPDHAQVQAGKPCRACQWEEDGLCRGCGEGEPVDALNSYCVVCRAEARADYLSERYREEGKL